MHVSLLLQFLVSIGDLFFMIGNFFVDNDHLILLGNGNVNDWSVVFRNVFTPGEDHEVVVKLHD